MSSAAFSQDCATVYLGTKTLYTAPLLKNTFLPNGYTSVFINHIGRHGARHLTKEVKKSWAYLLLLKADSAGALTKTGQQLKQMVLSLDIVETNHVESISVEGKTELKGIAERMQIANTFLFNKPLRLNIGITNKKRTKQSADAFLTGFKVKSAINEYIDDTDLRFYDLAPAYLDFERQGPWIPLLKKLQREQHIQQINQSLSAKIFTTDFAAELSAKQLEKFTTDIYGFSTIVYSLQNEIAEAGMKTTDLNFKSVFNCDELERLGTVDDADDFFKKGPGMDVNGIQVRIAVPLLINFIKTTDDFIEHGQYNVQLRFAHAETVAPFAALLGISLADKPTVNVQTIRKSWKAAEVAPLSSNVQWVLYKNSRSANYLVKILLNEKEAHITGLTTKTFPYYNYNDLKNFYIRKLRHWGVNINDDMGNYLKHIK